MPDHWGFVLAAYGIAALVLFAYWRHLIRRNAQLEALRARRQAKPA